MRNLRWAAALAGAASALPLIALPAISGTDVPVEELPLMLYFSVFLAIFATLPFGLLILLAARLSAVARWGGLAMCIVLNALAYYEFFRPSQTDGQAALIFLVAPFYLAVLVGLVLVIDLVVRAIARRVARL